MHTLSSTDEQSVEKQIERIREKMTMTRVVVSGLTRDDRVFSGEAQSLDKLFLGCYSDGSTRNILLSEIVEIKFHTSAQMNNHP